MIGFDSYMELSEKYHERHLSLVHSDFTLDQLDYEISGDKASQAEAERLYGYPIDIDKVWAHRDKLQNK